MAAASRAKVPLRCETIAEPRAAEIYERAYVLVRPDGHIAWRGDSLPKDPDALVELVSGGNPADEPTA
jgi:hypothetical protein